MYDNVTWISGWWLLVPLAIWFIIFAVLVNWLSPDNPKYGPADNLVASMPASFFSLIFSTALTIGLGWLVDALGFHFGFKQ